MQRGISGCLISDSLTFLAIVVGAAGMMKYQYSKRMRDA
jgi:hypothetical protein